MISIVRTRKNVKDGLISQGRATHAADLAKGHPEKEDHGGRVRVGGGAKSESRGSADSWNTREGTRGI